MQVFQKLTIITLQLLHTVRYSCTFVCIRGFAIICIKKNYMIWYITIRGNSSVGRALPCQGKGRGSESRFPLHMNSYVISREEHLL